MDTKSEQFIDEHRASILLGLPAAELRQLSREAGVGHTQSDAGNPPQGVAEQVVYTYDELHRICRLAARPHR